MIERATRATEWLQRAAIHVPLEPSLPQAVFLAAGEREVLLAGTGSSGKTTALVMAALAWAEVPHSDGLLVVPVLSASPVPQMLRSLLGQGDATWDAGQRCWCFPSGAVLTLSHRRTPPPGSHQFVGVDGLVGLQEDEYRRLLIALQPSPHVSADPVIRATSSPDGPGRVWVARRFGLLSGQGKDGLGDRRVIRASFETNPGVDAATVRRSLEELPEPRRSWLLRGAWGEGHAHMEDREAGRPATSAVVTAQPDRARPRVLLGRSVSDGEELWFDPLRPGEELPNSHVLITGESGSGKTQTIQVLGAGLMRQGVSPLVLDFKSDYDGAWARDQGLSVIDPMRGDRLPFNPLAPAPDPQTGEANGLRQVHLVADLLRRVWGLGDQQSFRIREATKAAYAAAGVPAGSFPAEGQRRYPTFEDVRQHLDPEDTLLGRLSPLFDLDPFRPDADGKQLAEMLERGTVVRLSPLPGSEAKASIAELLLLALYDHLARQGHARTLRWLLVMDEGWRLSTCPYLEPLLREGRAFGLGAIIATQFPRDLALEIKGCAATQLYFSQTQLDQVTEVQRAVLGGSQGREAKEMAEALRGLSRFEAVLHSRRGWRVARITPAFERPHGRGAPPEA